MLMRSCQAPGYFKTIKVLMLSCFAAGMVANYMRYTTKMTSLLHPASDSSSSYDIETVAVFLKERLNQNRVFANTSQVDPQRPSVRSHQILSNLSGDERHYGLPKSVPAPMTSVDAAIRRDINISSLDSSRCRSRHVWIKRPTEKQVKEGRPQPLFESRRTCAYSTSESEIAIGIFHCLAFEEGRLSSLISVWGKTNNSVRIAFLASASTKGKSQFPEEMMIYTPTQNDAYQSTLTKGLVGLQKLFEKFPDAKWFAIMGDDVFVDGPNLASALSAFNPNEEWCLAQCKSLDKDAEALTRGTSWRIFGGAPIITSQSLTKRLARFLLRYHELVQNGRTRLPPAHDLHFTNVMRLRGGGAHRITHLDGIYSLASGPYLGCPEKRPKPSHIPKTEPNCPYEREFLPDRTFHPWPAAIHQVRSHGYMSWHGALFKQMHVCNAAAVAGAQIIFRKDTAFGVSEKEYSYVLNNSWGIGLGNALIKLPNQWKNAAEAPLLSLSIARPHALWYVVVPDGMYVNCIGLNIFLERFSKAQAAHTPIVVYGRKITEPALEKSGYILSRAAVEHLLRVSRPMGHFFDAAKLFFALNQSNPAAVFISDPGAFIYPHVVEAASLQWPVNNRRNSRQRRQEWPQDEPEACAIMFSTNVDLTDLEWGYRESPRSLANILLKQSALAELGLNDRHVLSR